jgi:hypothetical protein
MEALSYIWIILASNHRLRGIPEMAQSESLRHACNDQQENDHP